MKGIIFTLTSMLFIAPAFGDTTTDLLNSLCEKGTLSAAECSKLQEDREQEVTEQRAERRRQALRQAQDVEKADKAKEKEATRVDGWVKDGSITWSTADGKFSVSPTMRLQLDYRTYQSQASQMTANTFDIRRAFLGLKGRFYENYDWLIVGDFSSNGTNVLDEAWLNVNYWTPLQFRVGQFKVPFSLEERTSDLFTDFMERSMGNAMVPNKERGFMFHGVPYVGTTYALGMTTGAGKNGIDTVNSVDSNDMFVAGTVNFSELLGWKDTVIHLGAGYSQGTQPAGAAISGRTEARGITFFTPTAFTGTELDRTRVGLEAAFAYNQFKVQGEMMNIAYSGNNATGIAYDREISSRYIDLMWLVTGEKYASSYKDGKFDRIKPTRDFDFKTWSGGAWEVGVRYSQFDAGSFATGGPAGTGTLAKPTATAAFTTGATSLTYGVNFIMNPRTKLMLNYVDTKFNSPVIATQATSSPATAKATGEKAIMMRFQYDF